MEITNLEPVRFGRDYNKEPNVSQDINGSGDIKHELFNETGLKPPSPEIIRSQEKNSK
jgi:hypothetical protein